MSDYQYPKPTTTRPPSAAEVALPGAERRLTQLEEKIEALLSAVDYLLWARIYALDGQYEARAEAEGYRAALKQVP